MRVFGECELVESQGEGFARDESVESGDGGPEFGVVGGEIWWRRASASGGDFVRAERPGAGEGSGAGTRGGAAEEIARVRTVLLRFFGAGGSTKTLATCKIFGLLDGPVAQW